MDSTVDTTDKCYCRKCMRFINSNDFYEAVDKGLVDTNGKMSVCKPCIQELYNNIFRETNSIEATIHKLCIVLNVKFTNNAMDATKSHINTLMEGGKKVNTIFGIYRQKLVATNKSMDKSISQYEGYEDIGAIFTEKQVDTKVIPIPQELIDFWGNDVNREDIQFLEKEYTNFKNTHRAESYAEIVLLKEVCFTMLNIKRLRANNDDTQDAVKELQTLMKSLAVSPNVANSNNANKDGDAFGLWIQEIEKEEPAQWLKTSPIGDAYRDVTNTQEYFEKFIVRPLKNFILSSKDFNLNEGEKDADDLAYYTDDADFKLIDDGELTEE